MKRRKYLHSNGLGTRRKQSGYALVAILTVSLFSMMLLLTLSGLTVQLSQSEAFYKQRELALVGADIALDYTRKSLNNSLISGTSSPLEPAQGESERISVLPASLVPQGANCRVLVRVRRLNPAEIQLASSKSSPAIEYQWNPNNYKKLTDWKYGDDWRRFSAPQLSYYWMVEVTSYRGIFAVSTRAMLAPDIGAPAIDPGSVSTPPTKDSLFVKGIVTDKEVNLATSDGYLDVLAPGEGFSNDQTTGSNPATAFKTVIQSNSMASTSPNTTLYGDLLISNPSGSTAPVAVGDNTQVYGRLQTNSILDGTGAENSYLGFQGNPGDLPSPNDNVLGMSDYFASLPDSDAFWNNGMRNGSNETDPIANLPSDTLNQVSPNQVPYGSKTAPLPTFPTSSPLDPTPPNDIIVSPGAYRASSFDSSNAAAKLIFNESGGPTSIFIDANSGTVNLSSEWIKNNGGAKDLQIFYAGDKDLTLNINGDLAGQVEMKAMIYAPNAKVTTSGFGEFQGSILAKSLKVNHIGDFRVDPDAAKLMIERSGQSGGGGGGASTIAGERLPTHYRIASWQQVSGSLVAAP